VKGLYDPVAGEGRGGKKKLKNTQPNKTTKLFLFLCCELAAAPKKKSHTQQLATKLELC